LGIIIEPDDFGCVKQLTIWSSGGLICHGKTKLQDSTTWMEDLFIARPPLKFQCSDPIPAASSPSCWPIEHCPCSLNLLIVPKLRLHREKWKKVKRGNMKEQIYFEMDGGAPS
jgi:hypothetical protein